MSIIAIDTETGGLDPDRHALLAIGAVAVDDDFQYRECFAVLVQPNGFVDPEAAEVVGYDLPGWMERGAVPEAEALSRFRSWLHRQTPPQRALAHNADFDRRVLSNASARSGIELPLHDHWVDSMETYATWREVRDEQGGLSLWSMAMRTGFWASAKDMSAMHHPVYDAIAAVAGYAWILADLRGDWVDLSSLHQAKESLVRTARKSIFTG